MERFITLSLLFNDNISIVLQISTKNYKTSMCGHEFKNAFVAGTRNMYNTTLFCFFHTKHEMLTQQFGDANIIYSVSSCNIKLHNLFLLAFFICPSEGNTRWLSSGNFIINPTLRRTQNRFVNVSIVIIGYPISAPMLLLSISYGSTTVSCTFR